MLTLFDLLLLTLFALAGIWFWRAQEAREHALQATRQHCQREAVDLLDQTVALKKVWLRRDASQRLRLWRLYQFEFTVTGGERYTGHTEMLGPRVLRIELPPHRFVSEAPEERLH
jgi:hypothetical protein